MTIPDPSGLYAMQDVFQENASNPWDNPAPAGAEPLISPEEGGRHA